MNQKPVIDIADDDLKTVHSILNQYIPSVEVWAFGSRVRGTARKYSDLDLAVISKKPLDFDTYATLKDAFSESTLPFKVDVVDWCTIDENFKKIINDQFVLLKKPDN